MTHGKRGCALCLSFGLHVIGFVALLAGMVTPWWSRVYDDTSGEVTVYNGLLVSMDKDENITLTDFNQFKGADSDKTKLYGVLALGFGVLSIFLEFFLVQAYGFAYYNASCGRAYNPDWLMIFSLLSGFVCITSLVLYEQFIGRAVEDIADSNSIIKMDYSRGFVIIFIALAFVAAFFTVCDRTNNPKDSDDDKGRKRRR